MHRYVIADAVAIARVSNLSGVARKTVYEYDHRNLLTNVTSYSDTDELQVIKSVDYIYDVLGRRVAKEYDQDDTLLGPHDYDEAYVLDGQQAAAIFRDYNNPSSSQSDTEQRLFWANTVDQLLAYEVEEVGATSQDTVVWTLTDHQGTVRDTIVRDPGTNVSSLDRTIRYGSFGAPSKNGQYWSNGVAAPSDKLEFYYTGQQHDGETGLQYSRARYYDPLTHEFTSQDPLGFAAGDTNLYRRVFNSPANATDPSGHTPVHVVTTIGGALIGGIIGGTAYYFASGDDFSWGGFAASVGGGAVVGALAGLTFGASLAVQSTLAAGGTAVAGTAGAYYGSGAAVGALHGAADVYAGSNGQAGIGAYVLGTSIGALAGAANPIGEFASFGGAVAGGFGEYMGGGSFLGNGFLTGGLAGSVLGGVGSGIRAGILRGGMRAGLSGGLRAAGPEVLGMGIGAGVGYSMYGREGILPGANFGMFGAAIGRGGVGLYRGLRTAPRGAVARSWQQVRRYWTKETVFQGNRVFQRDDLFDPSLMTSWKVKGKTIHGTNLERMATGRAPVGFDGKSVNMHHLIQTQDGAIAEVAGGMHQKYYNILHINTGELPSGINRSTFDKWREAYWVNRAQDFQ